MKIDYPIITSLLDDDLYKFTMGQVVFHLFPEAIVEWEFINRGKTEFPEGFADELKHQVKFLSQLTLKLQESTYLDSLPFMRPTYVEWLEGFRMNPNEVEISQTGGQLSIKIKGPWYRVIYWEVKLMALICELYYLLTGQEPDDATFVRMSTKAARLSENHCIWSDFGTRRRFSKNIQNELVGIMKRYDGFAGTSNPYFAMIHNVPVIGTSAHEAQMAMSAKYGVRLSNRMWLKHWLDFYQGKLALALTDTFTTDVFLRDFDGMTARAFDGVRHDSNDPFVWGGKMILHYKKLGIDTTTKKFVFSDGLTVDKYIKIHNTFKDIAKPIAGIGTHLTNDCGPKALNIVIKMKTADFGDGPKNVVKLSDEPGKHTGDKVAIEQAKAELGIL
jgi:nicotinate phosphoribosyltransferase